MNALAQVLNMYVYICVGYTEPKTFLLTPRRKHSGKAVARRSHKKCCNGGAVGHRILFASDQETAASARGARKAKVRFVPAVK